MVAYKIILTYRQTEELAKYCLEISKLSLGTVVFQLFVPGKLLFVLWGLTVALTFFILGIRLFKEVREVK